MVEIVNMEAGVGKMVDRETVVSALGGDEVLTRPEDFLKVL